MSREIASRTRARRVLPRLLISIILVTLLAACTNPDFYPEMATSVAPPAETPTEVALEVAPTPLPEVTLALPAPAPADPALVASIGIDPAQLSLNTQGLPIVWRANAVPGTPYTVGDDGVASGLPDHIQVNFGTLDPAQRTPADPVLFVIPVEAYRALWNGAEDGSLDVTLRGIFERSMTLPQPPPLRNLPALPAEVTAGRQDFATQVGAPLLSPSSSSRNGFRFVGRFVDESTPVTNEEMQYVYQGFSNDGDYLVAFFFPGVTNPALPATPADLTDAQRTEFNNGQDAALAATAVSLAGDATSAWTPDVALLDAIVASLSIPGVPANALEGNAWSLAALVNEGVETPVTGAPYQIIFNPGGAAGIVADCNVAAGQFVATGGIAGSLAIEMGPTTLAACPEGSQADAFVAALANAQEFVVTPGGQTLIIETTEGGPSLRFVPLGEPDIEEPSVEPPVIELPTPEPQLPMGRVIAERGANIRGGPGTNFPIIGFAPNGTVGLITGRNAAGDWYVFDAPSLPGGVGWISAPLVAATNVQDLPVIESPPTPVPTPTPVPPPTPTPAPVVPTPTPVVIPPTPTPAARINFSADRTQFNQGECATLFWDVENVVAVWVYPLGANFRDFPVTGQGSRQECPIASTTYEMRVQLNNGLLELRQVTLIVIATNPLAGTNWAVTQLYGGSVPMGEQTLTLSLAADNTFSGFGGCNTVTGTYSVNGSTINFVLNASTQVACEPDVNNVQTAFMNGLASTALFEFLGFQLVLRDFGGAETLRMITTN